MVGGGSKPSGSTTTVQKADPWEGQQPYLTQMFQEAQRLYDTKTPQYNTDAYNQALSAWETANGGAAPQYDMNAYNQAQATYKAGTGNQQPLNITDWRAQKGLPNYSVAAYQNYYDNFQPTPTGPAPKMEDYLIPGQAGPRPKIEDYALPGTEGSSALAPAYYPGQIIADQSPETLQAQNLLLSRATAGSPITNSASSLLTDTLQGKYLDPSAMPGFQRGLTDIADTYRYAVAPQTDAAFGRSGAYGGSAYNEAVQRNQRALGDSLTKYTGDIYNAERQKQMQSMLFAPQMANQDYTDINALAGLGASKDARSQDFINQEIAKYNYNANLPFNALANYQNLIQGNYGSSQTSTQPYYGNSGAGAVGGALSGGMLGYQAAPFLSESLGIGLPWLAGPYGAVGGALLGGLFS